jgi:flagellar biogenesis protein FliO
MLSSIQGIFGPNISPTLTFIILFAAILLGVLILIWLARRLLGGTLVSGGRSRQARLVVMDATPVDARRRLVLVRRDDVEHLILIGGPTDVVVEQNIRLAAPRQAQSPQQMRETPEEMRPVLIAPKAGEPVRSFDEPKLPEPRPVEPPRAVAPLPVRPQPAPAPPQSYTPRPIAPLPPRPMAPIAPRMEPVAPTARTAPVPTPPAQPVAPPVVAAPIVAAVVAPAVAAVTAQVAAPVSAPLNSFKEPEFDISDSSLEDSLFLDLSNEIGSDIDGVAPEISLEDEMEQLLANIDTKREKPL